jgi:CxxC-x17-CxxC domain-containing protein
MNEISVSQEEQELFLQEVSGDILQCVACRASFVLSDGERAYFKKLGLSLPRRCRPCRQKRAQREGQVKRHQPRIVEYADGSVCAYVRCTTCQKPTTVPFRPIEGKPALCATCYKSRPFGE